MSIVTSRRLPPKPIYGRQNISLPSELGFEFLAGAINISPLRGSGKYFNGWKPSLTVGLLPRALTFDLDVLRVSES